MENSLQDRSNFITTHRLQQKAGTFNDTLSILLPKFIRDRLTEIQEHLAEDQGEVCIVFIDISNFDTILSSQK